MSSPFLNSKDAGFLYKLKAFAGILSKRAFVGPYVVVIGGKYTCNYKCVFCEWFSPMRSKLRNEILSPNCYVNMDVYRELVKELSALGTKIILIDYLEPFTDPDLIEKIRYAKLHGLKCIIITNGSLINETNAEKLVDLNLDYLNVSINAASPETYPKIHVTENRETFHRIVSMISHIESLKEKRRSDCPHIRLSMVVCNRNYHDIVKLVDLCHNIGVKNVLFKKMIPTSKEIAEELDLTQVQEAEMKEYLVEASESAKRYCINVDVEWSGWVDSQKTADMPCYYGWLFSMIDGDGNVYPCCFQDRGPQSILGNISKERFSSVWYSKNYQEFRRKYKNIDARKKIGCMCNQPSCFFNNQQIFRILHEPYLMR